MFLRDTFATMLVNGKTTSHSYLERCEIRMPLALHFFLFIGEVLTMIAVEEQHQQKIHGICLLDSDLQQILA